MDDFFVKRTRDGKVTFVVYKFITSFVFEHSSGC